MKYGLLAGFFVLLMMKTAMSDDAQLTLFDFTRIEAAKEWQPVNDGVMGGVSDGRFKKPSEINSIGFMLGDKKAGPFKLEIEWIKVEQFKKRSGPLKPNL